MIVGSIVRSIAGRDRKRLFMIVGVCTDGSDRVMLADGNLRKISSPKKKSLRHLAVLAIANGDETSIPDEDDKLYEYLKCFEETGVQRKYENWRNKE